MLRYGRDYGRWNGQGRYDWERPGGYGMPQGGPRNDNWGVPRQNFGGEGPWMDEGFGGQPLRPGYDFDFGGGFGSGYGGGYGTDYFAGRGAYGGWAGRGGGPQGGWESGYGSGYGYEGGADEMGGHRGGGQGNNMRAADIMTEEPETVSPETTVAEVAQKMRDLDVGIIPVVDSEQGRRLRGVVTDRDITIRATAEGKDARSTRVSEVMTSDVETVNKNDRVRDVLEVMRRERVKRVPVTDREGRLVGIIAEADLLVEYEGGEQD
ncbi:MAG: CBS domain-containing protein, partial [Gemmatimonadetes bacterium]|nr:CBS domain-containing protein [Gemmatimonadota bacterium]